MLPAAICVTLLPAKIPFPEITVGTLAAFLVPLPMFPLSLLPHATSVPSEQRARLWELPAAMEITDLPANAPLAVTATGTLLEVVVPLPS